MPASASISIGGHQYSIAGESLVPRGKRGYLRRLRPLQDSDPGIPKTARWKLSGPIGLSRESPDGYLGHDHGTLETRFEDLLTSQAAVSTLALSGSDPLATGSSALGALILGGRALGGGTSLNEAGTITHIKEASSQIFVARGALLTQVNPLTWAVVATKAIGAVIRGMENWYGKLRVGLGGTKAIQTVTGVTATAVATYTDEQVSGSDTYGKEMTLGNDRLWWVRADPAGTNENRLRFTVDDFVSQSSGFAVGDPGESATGIGVMGPYTVAGSAVGVFGFTDEGIPFNILTALRDARSTDNGRKQAYQFGWNYTITTLGLYAIRGQIANPIGIGSDAMAGFEGFDGKPTAVLAWREVVFVCYEDSAGTTWRIFEGRFGANTGGTGELDLYPVATRTSAAVRTFGASSTPTLPAILWGEGANTLARLSKGRAGRDISDASYTYSTLGGQWFGSTMMRQQHLRKTVRWARFYTEDCDAANTWRVAVAFDGGAYTSLGTAAIEDDGAHKVVAVLPSHSPTGYTLKPRLTQIAASSTTPPKVRGYLEIGYDERPDQVTEIACVLGPISRAELGRLRALADADSDDGRQPVAVKLPEDSAVRYGYVTACEEQDLAADIIGAAVTLLLLDAA